MERLDNEVKKEERGATMVEYALMVALVAVVCIGAVQLLGRQASNSFSASSTALANTTN